MCAFACADVYLALSRCSYNTIAFIQFLGLYSSFDIPWDGSFKALFANMGLMNLNLGSLHVTCIDGENGGLSFRETWLIQFLLPLLYPIAVCTHFAWTRFLEFLYIRELPPMRLLVRYIAIT